MVNRNAARHLLLVASILLCFFVYIGYRLRSPAEPEQDPAAFVPEYIQLDDEPVAPLRPQGAAVSGSGSSGSSGSSGGDAPGGWAPSAPGGGANLAPPPAGLPAAPSADVGLPSGAITGLIPAPPADDAGGAVSGAPASGAPVFGVPPDDEGSPFLPSFMEDGSAATTDDAAGRSPFLPPPDDGFAAYSRDSSSTAAADAPLMTPASASPSAMRPPVGGVAGGAAGADGFDDSYAYETDAENPVASLPAGAAGGRAAAGSGAGAGAGASSPSAASSSSPSSAASSGSGAFRPSVPGAGSAAGETASGADADFGGDYQDEYGEYQDDYAEDDGMAAGDDAPGLASRSLRMYVVRTGDTLSNIAARELGSISLADNIFLLNRDVIQEPDSLVVGAKIRLPVRDGFVPHTAAVVQPEGQGRRPNQGIGRTHTVARGDTLSSIALEYYGTSAGWSFLHEANKTIIPNPNQLAVGTELAIPPYGN